MGTETIPDNFEVIRSRPHGHVMVILETIKKLGLDKIITKTPSRTKNLVLGMIIARIINPKSKLATARGFHEKTFSNSLGKVLNLERADEDELYSALDSLISKQDKIENKLATLHLDNGSLVLYDVTSTYLEGRGCELGKYGYNRDKKKGKTQIVFGLICDQNGCPIAVEVFEGNTSDTSTLGSQIEKVRKRFGVHNVVWVTDRGILTSSNIKELVKPVEGLDYISGLTKASIRKLAEVVDNMKLVLKGAKVSRTEMILDNFEVIRSRPHGHVMVILETIKKLGLDKMIAGSTSRIRNLVLGMIIFRIINPKSKLATARGFHEKTCSNSLGKVLNLEKADEDELYEALDWLLKKQEKIENKLASLYLNNGSLVLYDVTSTYLEGNGCELGKYGYNRDKKKGKTQIVFGLLCDQNGCPIAVEVFEGNTSDTSTLGSQIEKVRKRFGVH